jgi:hypothetical protein
MLNFIKSRPKTSLFLATLTTFTGIIGVVAYRNRSLIRLLLSLYKQSQTNDLSKILQGTDLHSTT